MKNLTKLALTGALIFGLNSCGNKDHQKYQDFANFIIKEGKKDVTGALIFNFSKDDKHYVCMYKKNISISVEGARVYEVYHDNNLDGVLDSYDYSFEGKHNHREIFEMLIDSIPKWYAEFKKAEAEQKSEKKLTELEKYNFDNKQVYEDFLKFCLENPNKREYAEKQYDIKLPHRNRITFTENGYIGISTNKKSFDDGDGDGLDDKLADGQTFKNKNTNLIESEFIKNMPLEKQLSLAKEYTNALKEIMHNEKYKNY